MLIFKKPVNTSPTDAGFFRVYGKALKQTEFYNASYSQMLSLFEGVKLTVEHPVVECSSVDPDGEPEESIYLSDGTSDEPYFIIRQIKAEAVPDTSTVKYLY